MNGNEERVVNSDILRFPGEYEAIQAFIDKGWTDGMPIIPPTKLRVDQFIDYCGRKPDENLGVEPVKGRAITIQKVAINSVMAGCLPEYFPIVLASIEAVLEPEFNLHYKNPWEIEKVKKYGNIIIASLDFPKDSTGDFLMKRIVKTHNKVEPIFVLGDLYAKNQVLCAIHTLDDISMENEININRKWILHQFRNILETRMKINIFKHGGNRILSEQINQMFGYTSEHILRSVLKTGCRFIDLSIFSSKFGEGAIPIVNMGYKHGNWKMMLNSTTFEQCIKIIKSIWFKFNNSII